MNINNLNTYQPSIISMADMCLARLKNGEPNTDVIPRKSTLSANKKWFDQNGDEITLNEMHKITGIKREKLCWYHTKYKGDCHEIFKRHGLTKVKKASKNSKYKDRNGEYLQLAKIKMREKISQDKVAELFKKAKFNHTQAYKMIDDFKRTKL